ncbi:MAG: hypothetical protein JXR81_02050 [Candidatus Goldbacteria bacterium]|nr:hypothetical protein [Candidatus Goldiibacteriota bacterium]
MNKNQPWYVLPAVSGLILTFMCIAPFLKFMGAEGVYKSIIAGVLTALLFVFFYMAVCKVMNRFVKTGPEKELKINALIFAIPTAGLFAIVPYFIKGVNFNAGDFSMLGSIYLPWGGYIKINTGGYALILCAGSLFVLMCFILMYRYIKALYFYENKNIEKKIFASFFIFFAAVTSYVTFAYPPTGDEPHYLLIARSIVFDFDVDLKNNYENDASYRDFYPAFLEYENIHNTPGSGGKGLYSLHSIGLPLLISPFLFIGGRFVVQFFMNFLAALCVMLLYSLISSSEISGKKSILFASLFGAVLPFSVNASLVLTEIPAALIVLYCLRNLMHRKGFGILFFAGIAFLPWLHSKYVILSVILYIIRYVIIIKGKSFDYKKEIINNITLIVSAVLFFLYYFAIYAKPANSAVSDIYVSSSFYFIFTFKHSMRAFFGILADRNFGILFYAPVYIFSVWGLIYSAVQKNIKMLIPALVAIPYLSLFLFWSDWGGSMTPARQLIPVIFVFAVYAAYFDYKFSLTDKKIFRAISAYSLILSLILFCMPFLRYGATKDKIASFMSAHGLNLGWFFPDFHDNITFIHAVFIVLTVVFTAAAVKYAKKGK